MEKGLNSYLKEKFNIKDIDNNMYSPLTLAYIGDGIYDLIIRTVVVGKGNTRANKLHQRTSKIVKAATQSAMIEAIEDELSTDEHDIYKRGRNAKSHTTAKNATMGDYRRATGFEALMGYLYLCDETDRMVYLIKTGLERIGEIYNEI